MGILCGLAIVYCAECGGLLLSWLEGRQKLAPQGAGSGGVIALWEGAAAG